MTLVPTGWQHFISNFGGCGLHVIVIIMIKVHSRFVLLVTFVEVLRGIIRHAILRINFHFCLFQLETNVFDIRSVNILTCYATL